jgi:hypothetical protein
MTEAHLSSSAEAKAAEVQTLARSPAPSHRIPADLRNAGSLSLEYPGKRDSTPEMNITEILS